MHSNPIELLREAGSFGCRVSVQFWDWLARVTVKSCCQRRQAAFEQCAEAAEQYAQLGRALQGEVRVGLPARVIRT